VLTDKALLKTQGYINGQWVHAENNKTYTVINPATQAAIADVADFGEQETLQAIAHAEHAMQAWKQTTAKARAAILKEWHRLIMENQADLAKLVTLEGGKPYAEAMGEVVYGASFIEWFAEEGKRAYGDVIPQHAADKRLMVVKQPVGVCAAITPWNFPIAMITRKCAPALAAGCAMVVKPAEATPLSALALAELGERAGIPAGVFSVVTAAQGAAVGKALTESPIVKKFSFTGSTAVGKILLQQCAGTVKKVSMELGGNAPFIVFDDADIDAAVQGAMASKYRNSGQTCVCANRFLVQAGIYDQFIEKFSAAVADLTVGNGMDAGVTQGPLINAAAIDKVETLLADATSKGARVACGGRRIQSEGHFFAPTIVADVTKDMDIFRKEIFGPVAPVFKFETEAEAIAMANDTEFGLAAYFYSQNIHRCFRVGEALEYGMVGINDGLFSTEVAPFGGMKESGLGREGAYQGLDEYLETKYMCLGGM
jgi:succinate-semialdehyde dehydrogenase/glutarate-semialdehyde dehydrogenase